MKKSLAEERVELKEKIANLEEKVKAGEDAALERVCKALKIEPEEVEAEEAKPRKPQKMVRMYVPHEVNINLKAYKGNVEVPSDVAEVLHQAIGARRSRLLKELTGKDYMIEGEGGNYREIGQAGE